VWVPALRSSVTGRCFASPGGRCTRVRDTCICSACRCSAACSDSIVKQHRRCERSEAIHAAAERKQEWIASAYALRRFGGLLPCEARAASGAGSSLSLLAMTSRYAPAFPRHGSHPSCPCILRPKEGVGNAGCPLHPRPRVGKIKTTRVSHHGRAGITRHSRTRMVLTVSFALSLVTGLFCHHRLRDTSRTLDASVGASGPHDFAVRVLHRSSTGATASTASPPALMTLRNAPLSGQDGASCRNDLPDGLSEIFFARGLDR